VTVGWRGRAAAALLSVVVAACGGRATVTDHAPGVRPGLDTDEAGLWMQMDRLERAVQASGQRVTDPDLDRYVGDLVCRLAGDLCPDVRVYILRVPHFNASMAPNGMMQVWTGLLLRVRNEAELAYVLGHEIGHFQRRHSLQLWRDARSKTDVVAFFSLLTSAAGVGFLGTGAQLAALSTVYAFSRDAEREADDLGFAALVREGYDPREAPGIWERLLEERRAAPAAAPPLFFATHPPTEERLATLRSRAAAGPARGAVGAADLAARVRPLRAGWLRDELRRREFESTHVLVDHLLATGVGPGELHFTRGELHRLRDGDGDAPRAVAAYRRALEHADAPPEALRGLGLVLARQGERAAAGQAYERYLAARPDAVDRELIRAELERLRP
jgi:hypothetical protein